MPFDIKYGDITDFKGDAIVNSLGTDTAVYGKLCDAIVKADDNPDLEVFLKTINGKAKILDCFITDRNYLPAKHIIHIVTPYRKDDPNHKKFISAYIKLLNLARENKYYRLAVPLIGTGPNGYSHRICKQIVESMCQAYVSYFPEMDITVYHHGSKPANTNNNNIVKFDIDELKDLIATYKTEILSGNSVYTSSFPKQLFLDPPIIQTEVYSDAERNTLLRQKVRDDFHETINFTSRKLSKCIYYINEYLTLRYGKGLFDQESDKAKENIKTLFGGGKSGSSNYGHLSEPVNHSKSVLLKVALACAMNTEETEQLLNVYNHSTTSLNNGEQAIYAFITQKFYDIKKIKELLEVNYNLNNLIYFK